ncbi:hypothetical protein [Sorangium sp. So ce1335]|uniref:hypothetical protein n=1 Tax=Sorangium sp. So ce1335 TaxID=3133335 RepID=UPI003F63FCC1
MPRRALVLALLLASFAPACSSSDPCEVVCARNAACQPDGPGEETCTALCNELSDRASYATAIERQAECYESEDWSCEALAGGACDYSAED